MRKATKGKWLRIDWRQVKTTTWPRSSERALRFNKSTTTYWPVTPQQLSAGEDNLWWSSVTPWGHRRADERRLDRQSSLSEKILVTLGCQFFFCFFWDDATGLWFSIAANGWLLASLVGWSVCWSVCLFVCLSSVCLPACLFSSLVCRTEFSGVNLYPTSMESGKRSWVSEGGSWTHAPC